MNCHETRELIGAYGDGELDAARNLEIERHLEECVACSTIERESGALAEAITLRARRFEAPAALHQQVMANLRAEAGERRVLPFPQKQKWVVWAIAALVLAGVFLTGVLIPRRDADQQDLLTKAIVASHVRSLMADHLADVASTDRHTVKPWFNGKLAFSPPVFDLAKEGFPLVGGRIDYFDQHPVAALVFGRDKHIINLFIWPTNATRHEKLTTGKTISASGYHLVHWIDEEMNFCAVSDLNAPELRQFAKLARERQTQ